MNILITGNRGYLGRHLVPAIQKKYPKAQLFYSNSSCNNLRENLDELATNGYPLDIIFHLAAWTKAGDFALTNQGSQWINNQLINTNILKFWHEYHPKAHMVAMGTSCAFDPELEKNVENYNLGDVDPDLYSYAMTKRMLYTGLQAFEEQFGMSYQLFIPSTLAGANFDKGDSHFIFDLVKKIIRGSKDPDYVVELWGDGYQRREIIDVNDAVNIILGNMHKEKIVNLANGMDLTIREWAEAICSEVGYDPKKIQYNTNKFTGVRSKKLVPNVEYNYTLYLKTISDMVEYVNSEM